MGSYTRFNGKFCVECEEWEDTLEDAFRQDMGYYGCDSDPLKVKVLDATKANSKLAVLTVRDEWRNMDAVGFVSRILQFFVKRGLVVIGGVDCEHEYGDKYRLEIRENEVYELEARVTYHNPKKIIINDKVQQSRAVG
jgi:hypothetical protein